MKWLKQIFCKHEWVLVETFVKSEYIPIADHVRKTNIVSLYCPKCGKDKMMDEIEWDLENRRRDIDEKYKHMNRKEGTK